MMLLLYLAVAFPVAHFLRGHGAAFQRLNDMNWHALVLVDVCVAFAIFWPLYVVGVTHAPPGRGWTISAVCAAFSMFGYRWAKFAEAAIDAVFFALTSQRGHCGAELAGLPAA